MATTTYETLSKPQKNVLVERWFFNGMALTMLAVAVAGFLPSIVHTAGRRAPISPLAAAHGILFFAWLIIFLVQSRLIATGHVALHRRVGVAAGFVLAMMIPVGYATTAAMVRRGFDLSGDLRIDHDPLSESIFPLGDLLMFTLLAIAAIAYRRRPEIHKRLMLFANISLMGAPLAHFIGHARWFAAMPGVIIMIPISMFLIAAVARDYRLTRRVRPLTLGLAIAMFLFGPLRANVFGPSAGMAPDCDLARSIAAGERQGPPVQSTVKRPGPRHQHAELTAFLSHLASPSGRCPTYRGFRYVGV
jgi:hypothetical protein